MKLRQTLVLILPLFLSCHLSGQKDSTKQKGFCPCLSGLGYNWQGTNNVDIGIQPSLLLNKKNNHNNIGISIAANVMYYNNSFYVTPITKIRIMIHEKLNIIGWVASVGHSYTNVLGKYDHRITPELGIHFPYGLSLTVGYNIPISTYQDKITSPIRVGLRLNSH
jgi:hypothetical protein